MGKWQKIRQKTPQNLPVNSKGKSPFSPIKFPTRKGREKVINMQQADGCRDPTLSELQANN